MDELNSGQVIRLAPMQQLAEVLDLADDDWTGLTDAVARRKRQNRLNQRAYRRRKALQLQPSQIHGQGYDHQEDFRTGTVGLTPQSQYVLRVLLSTLKPAQRNTQPLPNGPSTFPLSTDHLIPLIQLNVLRATLTNLSILSLISEVPDTCGIQLIPLFPAPPQIPACLAPTALQRAISHGYWIDIIPSPALRDNCIRWLSTIDEEDLCSDFIGGLYEGKADSETRGWIVWNQPWDVNGWEVSEGWLRKWGRLLGGCRDLIEASNRWRALRGEEPLVVEV